MRIATAALRAQSTRWRTRCRRRRPSPTTRAEAESLGPPTSLTIVKENFGGQDPASYVAVNVGIDGYLYLVDAPEIAAFARH